MDPADRGCLRLVDTTHLAAQDRHLVSVAIAGTAETAPRRGATESPLGMAVRAAAAALADAGLGPADVDGIVVPPVGIGWDEIAGQLGLGEVTFTATSPTGGASAVGSVMLAALAVEAGLATTVLIPFAWHGYTGTRGAGVPSSSRPFTMASVPIRDWYRPAGLVSAAGWTALMAQHYVGRFGTQAGAAAAVAVAARANAARHPLALMREVPLSLEDYHRSPVVADPLRILDCCLETDAAAAVVVTSLTRARDLPQSPVVLLGAAEGHATPADDLAGRADLARLGLHAAVAPALARAGVGLADVDVFEVYDCFTYVVLMQLEALGLVEPGGAGDLVTRHDLSPTGSLPLNTHGGLLSHGHSWGMGHLVEAAAQVRGEARGRQVPRCEIAAVTGFGNFADGALLLLGADRG
jgi:acetyl-CoA acetyltransferase